MRTLPPGPAWRPSPATWPSWSRPAPRRSSTFPSRSMGNNAPLRAPGRGPAQAGVARVSTSLARMRVRLATTADAEAVRDIYNIEVLESTVTFDLVPRSQQEQLTWLEEHRGAYPCIVAVDDDDRVVGWASLSPYKSRPAYATSVEDSVYVHREERGHGVGRLLLAELIELAGHHGFHTVLARIVGGHEPSIGLHR